jgi:hypothetical protein
MRQQAELQPQDGLPWLSPVRLLVRNNAGCITFHLSTACSGAAQVATCQPVPWHPRHLPGAQSLPAGQAAIIRWLGRKGPCSRCTELSSP